MSNDSHESLIDTGNSSPENAPSNAIGHAPKGKMTDARLRALKPETKIKKYAVEGGLYIEVTPGGSKLWRWKYRIEGKENRYALGSYPELSLKDAREAVEAARKLVRQGLHPAKQKRLDRIKTIQEQSNILEAIAKEWLALKDWKEITKKRRQDMLTRVVFPTLGQLPIKQITSPIILDVLKKAGTNNGLSVMAEAKRTLFGIFEFALEVERIDVNPVRQWREALPKNKTQHKRPLEEAEIGRLLRDVDNPGGSLQTQSAFKLMWLTLARPSEAVEAEWSEFDLDKAIWRIPVERMKMSKEHVIPLPTQAVELLRRMHAITGERKHVFPHRDDRTKPMVAASFRQMLNVLGWSGKFSPHATRTTGSTRLNEMGFSADWIERQLAHTEPNTVRRTYNHADHLKDRAVMMQQWADWLDLCKKGENNVVLIKQPITAVK